MRGDGSVLLADQEARLKPCLRCGYSLRAVMGGKNCPECGLAVRVTLAGNSALEWSNPAWQKVIARGLSILLLAQFCKVVAFVTYWIFYFDDEEYISLGERSYQVISWIDRYASEAFPIICALALCLLTKKERRHPDLLRGNRIANFTTGLLLFVLGVSQIVTDHVFWLRLRWIRYVNYTLLGGPWIPLALSVLIFNLALQIGRRSRSRAVSRLSQIPIWTAVASLALWVLSFQLWLWQLQSLVTDLAFPISMMLLLVFTVRALRAGAREADQNWVTDL